MRGKANWGEENGEDMEAEKIVWWYELEIFQV